jgi:hypothetical protein
MDGPIRIVALIVGKIPADMTGVRLCNLYSDLRRWRAWVSQTYMVIEAYDRRT